MYILVQSGYAFLPPSTYLVQSQRVAISWCDSVDRGVKGQPALVIEVVPTERKQNDRDRTTSQGGFLLTCKICLSMSSSLLCSILHVKINLNCSVEIPFIT